MSLISGMRRQTAVYWALEGEESSGDNFDEFGQPQYTTPIEISVRWEARTEEFLDAKGTRILSNAIVYVDRDVDIAGVLMLGELTDITNQKIPKENDDAWEIKRYEKLPNLRNTEILRTVFL